MQNKLKESLAKINACLNKMDPNNYAVLLQKVEILEAMNEYGEAQGVLVQVLENNKAS